MNAPNLASAMWTQTELTLDIPEGGQRLRLPLPRDSRVHAWGFKLRNRDTVGDGDAVNLHYAINSPHPKAHNLQAFAGGRGEYLAPGCAMEATFSARDDRKERALVLDLRGVAAFSTPAPCTAIITIYPLEPTGEGY